MLRPLLGPRSSSFERRKRYSLSTGKPAKSSQFGVRKSQHGSCAYGRDDPTKASPPQSTIGK
eukprot:15484073-Alexandrium_andersonii.AAC.1